MVALDARTHYTSSISRIHRNHWTYLKINHAKQQQDYRQVDSPQATASRKLSLLGIPVKSTLQIHNLLNIVLSLKSKPSSDDVATPTLHKAITLWETRHALAHEALLNTLNDTVLIKVHQLETAKEIWNRLATEFGTSSDLKYAQAEAQLRALLKNEAIPMNKHINRFEKLREA